MNKTYCLFGKQVDVDVYREQNKPILLGGDQIEQDYKIKISDQVKNNNLKKKCLINYVKINSGLFDKTNELNGYKFNQSIIDFKDKALNDTKNDKDSKNVKKDNNTI